MTENNSVEEEQSESSLVNEQVNDVSTNTESVNVTGNRTTEDVQTTASSDVSNKEIVQAINALYADFEQLKREKSSNEGEKKIAPRSKEAYVTLGELDAVKGGLENRLKDDNLDKTFRGLDGFDETMGNVSKILENTKHMTSRQKADFGKVLKKHPEIALVMYSCVHSAPQKPQDFTKGGRPKVEQALRSFNQKGLSTKGSVPTMGDSLSGVTSTEVNDGSIEKGRCAENGLLEGNLRFNNAGDYVAMNPRGKAILGKLKAMK